MSQMAASAQGGSRFPRGEDRSPGLVQSLHWPLPPGSRAGPGEQVTGSQPRGTFEHLGDAPAKGKGLKA